VSWFVSKPSVDTRDISTPLVRSAAETVDAQFGKTGDHRVTHDDVAQARAALRGDPAVVAKSFGALEVDLLERHLDTLDQLVDQAAENAGGAFASSLAVNAIRDQDALRCAAAISTNFGENPSNLNLKELVEARAAFVALESGELERTNPKLAKKLKAVPQFNKENLDAIESFMRYGHGGLVDHGPMTIALDRGAEALRFEHVFKLSGTFPVDSDELEASIKRYESELSKSGYDRVYLTTEDSDGFYVAVVDKGFLPSSVRSGTRAQQGTAENPGNAFRVISVCDTDNTLLEAATRPLATALVSIKTALAQFFGDKLAQGIHEIIDGIGVKDPKLREVLEQRRLRELKNDALNVGKLGLAGATAVYFPLALGVGLAGWTALNVLDYFMTTKSARPFFGAVGVVVERPGPIEP